MTNKVQITNFKKAFTLVEILLAVFVLEIGLLGIAAFYAYSFRVTKIARNQTIASNLASGLLDEKLAGAYDNLAVGAGSREKYSPLENDPFYSWDKKIDITYIDSNLVDSFSGPDTNMKKILVTVYWQEYNHEKSFQTATIKAKH